jgi:oligosaccharide reducing-end xylanase
MTRYGSKWIGTAALSVFIMIAAACSGRPKIAGARSGAFYTGRYPNLFAELLGKSESETRAKIDTAWARLFHGSPESQSVCFPAGPDMAYIEDIQFDDVRSEGMSYGMMIAVQLDKKDEFDRLWKWTKVHMQHPNGPRKGYFAWQLKPDGTVIDPMSASDGEEWIVTGLFLASSRWGDGKGIYDYRAEAQAILDAMLCKGDTIAGGRRITNMFNAETRQVVFVPAEGADGFTDPSYHVPHFYELWARRADKKGDFWADAAVASREFLKKACHPVTGLAPDYAEFDGRPADPWKGGTGNFRWDAWRVAMNVAVDHVWFGGGDGWASVQSDRLLGFFKAQGMRTYGCLYTLDGRPLSADHNTGLVAMNATAALAATADFRKEFVQALWDAAVPQGTYRYYDGLLYMLALLQVGGHFRVYPAAGGR